MFKYLTCLGIIMLVRKIKSKVVIAMGTDYLSMYGYNVNFKTAEEVADTMTDVVLELEGAWGQIKDIIEEEDLGLSDKKKENFSNFAEDMRVRCGAALT